MDKSEFLHAPDLMRMAHEAALEGLFRTSPNPRVGCVLADAYGRVLGRGSTQQAGGPHAEVMALSDARLRGNSVVGATAYVTLEPCSHQGRTGPCCDALIAAGIRRVVGAMEDPNPMVKGRGFERLRAASVEVEVGLGQAETRELNIGFLSRMTRGRPWVRMKSAASVDGRTALPDGQSQWITSEPARIDTHQWRARSCAVLTGIGTVMSDNPRLDVRLVPTPRQPWLVVLDSDLKIPADSTALSLARKVIVFCVRASESKKDQLTAQGVEVVLAPEKAQRVDVAFVLAELGRRGVNELHVEAGSTLNGALLAEGLVDEIVLYVAPKIMGAGRGIADFPPLPSLDQAPRFEWVDAVRVGDDLRILGRFHRIDG